MDAFRAYLKHSEILKMAQFTGPHYKRNCFLEFTVGGPNNFHFNICSMIPEGGKCYEFNQLEEFVRDCEMMVEKARSNILIFRDLKDGSLFKFLESDSAVGRKYKDDLYVIVKWPSNANIGFVVNIDTLTKVEKVSPESLGFVN